MSVENKVDEQGTGGLTKSLLASWSSLGDNDKIDDTHNYGATATNSDDTNHKRVDEAITSSSSSSYNGSGDNNDNIDKVTYVGLLRTNQNFRYFWFSYVVNRLGDWMTYLASISLIQEVTTNNASNNNTLISILIMVKLLPNVICMPIGGILADSYDRRKVQIILDVASSGVVVIFLWSLQTKSIPICYFANFLQEVLSGLYGPSNSAMLPQLVSNDNEEELKKATTLTGLTWSLMAAFGSTLGGILVAAFGIRGCFIIDSVTYLVSAAFLYFGVQGNYDVTATATTIVDDDDDDDDDNDNDDPGITQSIRSTSSTKRRPRSSSASYSLNGNNVIIGARGAPTSEILIHLEEQDEEHPIITRSTRSSELTQQQQQQHPEKGEQKMRGSGNGSLRMFVQGLTFAFVEEPLVGAYALLKGSGSIVNGATDVLNVSFSARGSESNPSLTSLKLGFLFGCVGIGCIIGSVITDIFAKLSHPKRIAQLCLVAYCFMSIGCFVMALVPNFFDFICVSVIIRSIGAQMIWINSTLLIQKFTPPGLLGRVNSIDTGVALFGEALSALGGGLLMDKMDVSPEDLSLILAAVSLWFVFFWSPLAFKSPKKEAIIK